MTDELPAITIRPWYWRRRKYFIAALARRLSNRGWHWLNFIGWDTHKPKEAA